MKQFNRSLDRCKSIKDCLRLLFCTAFQVLLHNVLSGIHTIIIQSRSACDFIRRIRQVKLRFRVCRGLDFLQVFFRGDAQPMQDNQLFELQSTMHLTSPAHHAIKSMALAVRCSMSWDSLDIPPTLQFLNMWGRAVCWEGSCGPSFLITPWFNLINQTSSDFCCCLFCYLVGGSIFLEIFKIPLPWLST